MTRRIPFNVALGRGMAAAFIVTLLVCGAAFITNTEVALGRRLVVDDQGASTTLSVSLAVPVVLAIVLAVGLWAAGRLGSSPARRATSAGE